VLLVKVWLLAEQIAAERGLLQGAGLTIRKMMPASHIRIHLFAHGWGSVAVFDRNAPFIELMHILFQLSQLLGLA
jgi:hypothetical protein